MAKLSGPMVTPKSGAAPRQVVVLLHGYGSDGADLIGLAGPWRDILPDALFVAPNGPAPCAINPGGYEWFPLERDDPDYRVAGARLAQPIIAEFLGDLWRQTGLGPAETLLCGFSQGAMMALNVALTLDTAVMGVVAFSGALIAPADFADYAGPRPPVCLVHGDRDPVVDVEMSVAAAAALNDRGFDVALHISPGSDHTIAQDGLAFASAFLAERLAAA